MTDDPLEQQLLEAFATEVEDNLTAMEQAILQLERTPEDMELVGTIFRAAHSIKGDAACVGRTAVADCAHGLEDLVERLGNAGSEVSPQATTVLLRTVDALRRLVAAGDAPSEGREEILEDLHRAAAEVIGTTQHTSDAASPAVAPAPAARRTLRVDVARLDQLLDLTGELTVARGRLEAMLQNGEPAERLLEVFREADRLHAQLQEIVSRARMVPVGPMFRQFARTVRDVSAANGKLAELILEGEDVEVDTNVVDHLRDPLTHMIRNAIDHGIEAPDERVACAKNVVGKLTLSAMHESGTVVIRLADDGRGLERQKLLERGQRRGVVAAGASLSDSEVQRLIFEPGLSTADEVSELSGRGLGMDIVRRSVESLRGRIDTASTEGRGTTFTIRLPLTLAIIDGFGFRVGGETFIVPVDTIVECVQLCDELTTCDGDAGGLLNLRDKPLPYVRLRHHFELGVGKSELEYVIVVHHGDRTGGLVVDELLGGLQVVIKPLNRLCKPDPAVTGSAVLGDGRVALIVDAMTILDKATTAEAIAAAAPERTVL